MLMVLANVADLKYRVVPAGPDQAIDPEIGGCGRRCRKIQAGDTLSVALIATVEGNRTGTGNKPGMKAGSYLELIRHPGDEFQD
jgi:hypothetical protein